MKIGILTFHYGTNYGGILQCYALYSYLKTQGHDVEVIDYRGNRKIPLIKRVRNKLKTITSFKKIGELFRYALFYDKVSSNNNLPNPLPSIFDEFRKTHLTFSPKVDDSTIKCFSSRYDCVIVGSDQVWTDLYSGNMTYFLDWIADDSPTRRVAYAACSAHDKINGSYTRKLLNKLLLNFEFITVRDLTTLNLIGSVTDKQSHIVADPTLLYDFREFISLDKREPYILAYLLDSEIDGGHDNAIQKIREQYGDLPVRLIYIPGHNDSAVKCADEVLTDVTPEQWVDFFAHASFVYTDSFHAIMFAMKFNKPLLAYYTNPVRASRLIDLKKRFPSLNILNKCPEAIDRFNGFYKFDGLISESKSILQSLVR